MRSFRDSRSVAAPGDACDRLREFVTGPVVWTRSDLHDSSRWTYAFAASEMHHLTHVACSERLPRSATVTAIRAALLEGCGFSVARGFDAEGCDLAALTRRFCALAAHFGEITAQNADGETVQVVADVTASTACDLPGAAARGHRGHAAMQPHSDSADMVALLCVRRAKRGGATRVSSSSAIYNEILRTRPELLDVLCAGFHFDMTGKSTARPPVSDRIPVFRQNGAQVSCTFNKARIEVGMRLAGLALDDLQQAAITYLRDLAMRDEFSIEFVLQPGEILFLNSAVTLHGRAEYEDWPEPDRRRLLLRLWTNAPREGYGHESVA